VFGILALIYGLVLPALLFSYYFFPKISLLERGLWVLFLSLMIVPLVVYFVNKLFHVPLNYPAVLVISTVLSVGASVLLWWDKNDNEATF
jgi:hypothetical protein